MLIELSRLMLSVLGSTAQRAVPSNAADLLSSPATRVITSVTPRSAPAAISWPLGQGEITAIWACLKALQLRTAF